MKKLLKFAVLSLTLVISCFCLIVCGSKKQKSNLDENSNSKTIKSEDNSKLGEENAKEIVHEYLGDGKFHFNAGHLYDNEYVEKLIFYVYYDNTDSRFNITLNGDLDYNNITGNKNDFSKNSYYEDSENKIHRFYIENDEDKNMNGIYEFKAEGSAEIKDIKLVLVKTNLNHDDYLYSDSENSIFKSNYKRQFDKTFAINQDSADGIVIN